MTRRLCTGILCLLGMLFLSHTAHAQLTADFSFTGNTSCAPAQVSFTDISTGGTPITWNWQMTTPNGSWTFSTQQNPTTNFWQGGDYDVTLEVSDGTTTSTITKTVTVAGPSFDWQQYTSTQSGTCAPADLTVSYGATIFGTWFWDMGDGTSIPNLNNFTHTYTQPGWYNPSLTITDPAGCVQTFWVDSVFISNGLCLNADVTQPDCGANPTGEIDLTITGGTAPYTILWSNGATTEDLTGLAEGIYTVTVTDANNQTEVGAYEIDASLITLDFISVPTACDGTGGSLAMTITGGTAPYSILWSNGATTNSIAGLTAGGYSVTVTDANGCSDHDVTFVPYADTCRVNLSGRIYYDQNQNCVYDIGVDAPLQQYIHVTGGPFGWWVYPDSSGHYELDYYAGPANIEPNIWYYSYFGFNNAVQYSCPSTGEHVLPFQSNDSTNLDFGLYIDSSWQDLAIDLWVGAARPGFVNQQWIYVHNEGGNVQSPVVTWTHDPLMTFTSANPPVTSYDPTTRTATWNLPTLAPLQHDYIHIYTLVDSTASLGDLTCHNAVVDPIAGDSDPVDNVDTTCRVLTASYDPNDKQVSPAGMGRDGFVDESTEWFTYTVRFQNTGNDTAFFVVIRDTLDEEFIPGSLTPLAHSHPYKLFMGESGELTFRHEWINLPDSTTNPEGSQGFISYRVRKRDGMEPGDQLTNVAAIYFDFNDPIITNTTLNTLTRATVGLPDPSLGLAIYPNPAHEFIWVESAESNIEQIDLVTIGGQTIQRIPVNGLNRQSVSLEGLPKGLYLLRVRTPRGVSTHKVTLD